MNFVSALNSSTFVQSSQTSSASSAIFTDKDNLEEQKTDFLKILLTQLANQNPLDPMSTDEYTAQLVAYSQLEQLIEINDKSAKQLEQANNGVVAASLSYIGQDVEIKSNMSPVQNNLAQWNYTIEGVAEDVFLTVVNKAGQTVWEGSGTNLATGANTVSLDTTSLGLAEGDVLYLSVNPEDIKGNKLNSEISSFAKVDGVRTDGSKTYLTSGQLSYTLSDVLKITS